MKIGVVGAGAVGTWFAGRLAQVAPVTLLTRRAALAVELARHGIRVDGVPVGLTVVGEPGALAEVDVLLVAVKSYETAEALGALRPVVRASAVVATLQNGVDAARDASAALPGLDVVAAPTTQGVTLRAPGDAAAVGRGTTRIGRDRRGAADALAELLRAVSCDAVAVDDAGPAVWEKAVVNVAINPLCALARRPNGAIVDDPELAAAAMSLALEAAAVARAEGVVVADPVGLVTAVARSTASNRCSMLTDLDRGRPTEIDAIAGALVGRARAHGLAVPATELAARLVRAARP